MKGVVQTQSYRRRVPFGGIFFQVAWCHSREFLCGLNPFTTGKPFLGTKLLGFSIGRGSGALKGLSFGAGSVFAISLRNGTVIYEAPNRSRNKRRTGSLRASGENTLRQVVKMGFPSP